MIIFKRSSIPSYHDNISNGKVRTRFGVSRNAIDMLSPEGPIIDDEVLKGVAGVLRNRTDMLDQVYEQMSQLGGKFSILEMQLNNVSVNVVMRRNIDIFGFKQSLAVILPNEYEEYNEEKGNF